jgi:hypothetical protein
MNKYKYLLVIQQYYSNCWEDASEYECNSQGLAKDKRLIHEDKKNYILLGYPTRVIFRKELNYDINDNI